MIRLLVDAPSGEQLVIEVSETGGYFDDARVLWDERVDGPLPEDVVVGGMVRDGDTLRRDADRKASHDAVRLAAARKSMCEVIKMCRDHLSDQGGYKVVVDGADKWFHSDPKSKTQQLGLVMMGAAVPPVQWKTMDGSFVTMTQALAGAIFQAAAAQDMALFAAAETHLAALGASAEPEAYDFSAGWPATFGGAQ